jgi:hypothetical protein
MLMDHINTIILRGDACNLTIEIIIIKERIIASKKIETYHLLCISIEQG